MHTGTGFANGQIHTGTGSAIVTISLHNNREIYVQSASTS